MTDKQMDQFMKKLEDKLKPGFMINQDCDLTEEIMKALQRDAAQIFTGEGSFYPGEMRCIGNAHEENGTFIVEKNGTVFGPYIHMAPGFYDVVFDLDVNDAGKILLQVAFGKNIIVSREYTGNGEHTLSIHLKQKTEGLEFRLFNIGDQKVIFRCVRIMLSKKVKYASDVKRDMNETHDQAARIRDELRTTEIVNLNELGKCFMPMGIRARFFKRVIRKLIRCYTAYQTNFNLNLVNIFKRLNEKVDCSIEYTNHSIASIANAMHILETEIKDCTAELACAKRQTDEIFAKLKLRDGHLSAVCNNDKRINQEFEKIMKQDPVIKDTAKEIVNENGGKIRLHIGCGHLPVKGYINIDTRDLPGVDVVASVDNLPYGKDEVDEIFLALLIEHFEYQIMLHELMPYWYSLLVENGKMRVIFPDAKAMVERYNEGSMSFEQLSHSIMGKQDYNNDYHYTMYSIEKVKELLKSTGFKDVVLIEEKRENDGCLESEIIAFKRNKPKMKG